MSHEVGWGDGLKQGIDTGTRKYDQGTPHPTGKLLRLSHKPQTIDLNIAWYQEHGAGIDDNGTAGRSFYTSLGHLNETWKVRARFPRIRVCRF